MSSWTKPPVAESESRSVSERAPDFWIEALTAGVAGGRTFMDGKLLQGVQKVTAETEVDGITTVTITFIARTLNKGERPPE